MRPGVVVLLLSLMAGACGGNVTGLWAGEAAIALSTSFGSPVGFTCVVAWDLHYGSNEEFADVAIDVRFPSAVQDVLVTTTPAGLPLTQPWPRFDEWRRWTTDSSGPASLEAMRARRHLVGASGVPCRAQNATAAVRGSELRLRWKANRVDHEQTVVVRDVRQWVRSERAVNGEPRLEWTITQ